MRTIPRRPTQDPPGSAPRKRAGALILILLAIGFFSVPFVGAAESAAADATHHYVVLDMQEGRPVPLFYRAVSMRSEPPDAAQLATEGAEAAWDQRLQKVLQASSERLAVSADDAHGLPVFRQVIEPGHDLRGEFRAQPGKAGAREGAIEAVHHAAEHATFVLRLPIAAESVRLTGRTTASTLVLRDLAATAASLPLAGHPAVHSSRPVAPTKAMTGDPANRLDVLILGDGFTDSDLFTLAANAFGGDFVTIDPFIRYANYLNIDYLFTPSAQMGADHPPFNAACMGDDPSCCADPTALSDPLAGTYVNTAFGARFCSFNQHRLLVTEIGPVLAAASASPDWDQIVVLVNDTTYGGSGGVFPVASQNAAAVEIAQHEFGHTFGGLADEYDTPFPGFPACTDTGGGLACEANVTDETNPALIKWAPWIDASTPLPTPENDPTYAPDVGLFEGGRYLTTGMYRPRNENCLMHLLGLPFCEICAQELVLQLYRGGWGMPMNGIDLIEPGTEMPTPGAVTTPGSVGFSADLLVPVGQPLDVRWLVDGVEVPGANGNSFVFTPTGSGSQHTVELRVEDPTSFIHPQMRQGLGMSSRTWNVTVVPTLFYDGFENGDFGAWAMATP